MSNFTGIFNNDINDILSKVKRQYFVGNLANPQEIEHVHSEDLEIGITFYDVETTEEPHWHPVQTEFGYMLSGECTWVDIQSNEEVTYYEGDFFSIKSNTCYTQTAKANTKILFIKTPSINDKQTCSSCNKECSSRK